MCKFEKIIFKQNSLRRFFLNRRTQVLPPLNYVYYTWSDPVKARKLVISCGSKKTQLELNVRNFLLV
jgi:hypothetical protein